MTRVLSLEQIFGSDEEEGSPELHSLKQTEKICEYRLNRFKPEDAKEMLKEAYAVLQQQHTFSPGQIIRYKPGLETNSHTPCGGVSIFLRYQECPDYCRNVEAGLPLASYDKDCVIGTLLPNGAMAEYYSCSRYLEPAE